MLISLRASNLDDDGIALSLADWTQIMHENAVAVSPAVRLWTEDLMAFIKASL